MRLLHVLLAVFMAAVVALVGATPARAEIMFVNYSADVQSIGWQPFVAEAETAGTTGQSLRMEALVVRGIRSTGQAHMQDVGWMEPRSAGYPVGLPGEGLRLEAVRVRSAVAGWGIECRAHVQNIGWRPWVADGATCGTTGRSLRLEAVQLRLVRLAR